MKKMNSTESILRTILFSQLSLWDVKRYKIYDFYLDKFPRIKLENVLNKYVKEINLKDNVEYKQVTVKLYGKGVILRDIKKGSQIKTKKQYFIKSGQFIYSKIDARNGAFGIVPEELEGAIITNSFSVFNINSHIINPTYLFLITSSINFRKICERFSSGTTGRRNITDEILLNLEIPLPPLEVQDRLVAQYNVKIQQANQQEQKARELEQEIENYLFEVLGIEKTEEKKKTKGLQFVRFKELTTWNIRNNIKFLSKKFQTTSFEREKDLYTNIFRGKSPKYDKSGNKFILNQKCNRWNYIDLQYAKKVNEDWYKSIDKIYFTKENDILINSTGEGTIGRASLINKQNTNLLYDSHILLLRLNKERVNPLFYVLLFNSKYGQMQVESIKSAQSTNQTELGVQNLKKIVFPLPPLSIQKEIVRHISELKQQIKDLRRLAEENRKQAIKEFEQNIFVQ